MQGTTPGHSRLPGESAKTLLPEGMAVSHLRAVFRARPPARGRLSARSNSSEASVAVHTGATRAGLHADPVWVGMRKGAHLEELARPDRVRRENVEPPRLAELQEPNCKPIRILAAAHRPVRSSWSDGNRLPQGCCPIALGQPTGGVLFLGVGPNELDHRRARGEPARAMRSCIPGDELLEHWASAPDP